MTASAERRALPIAGDDMDAKRVISELQDAFAFDTFDAGPLSAGRRFEEGMPAYCQVSPCLCANLRRQSGAVAS